MVIWKSYYYLVIVFEEIQEYLDYRAQPQHTYWGLTSQSLPTW